MPFYHFFRYFNKTNLKNALFHFRTYGFRSMFRKTMDYLEFTRNYNLHRTAYIASEKALMEQQLHTFSVQPKISIIVPVYKTSPEFLRQMIESVTSQTYKNWELCIADGSADSSASYIPNIISEYQQNFPNIKYTQLSDNLGISGNTNAALALATGDFIGLLDHDDILTPDTLYEIVRAVNSNSEIDVLYTDEDKVDISLSTYYDPYFKPDFNLDLLRSCNYITHFFVVKKQLADSTGGFSVECNGSQDYDFILKTCERAQHIHHIPKILYHWRIHPASVAGDPENKTYAYDSAVRALQNHLDRCKEQGAAMKSPQFGYYKISYGYSGSPLISILTIDCPSSLKKQIREISTYTNYEFIQNPKAASGEFLVVLYQVKKILTPDWIEQFLGNCSRSSVGIAGAKIYYKKGRILEYGLIYTPDGRIHSPFYKYRSFDTGYCFRAQIQQNCSLIGPYCFMTRTSVYQQLFPQNKKEDFQRLIYHFCYALSKKHLSVTLIPDVSVLCRKRHTELPVIPRYVDKYDPYYNPNFSTRKLYHLTKS